MKIEELRKKYKELLDSEKKSEKYFYSEIQDFARKVENFYYSDKSKFEETSEFIINLYKTELPLFDKDDYAYKSTRDELTRILLEIAGFGIDKELEVQKYFLEKFISAITNENLTDLVIKVLDKYLDLQGTETSLSEDGKSIGIKSFYINLNPSVREIRKEALKLLFEISKKNSGDYEIVKSAISAIKSNVHSLAYLQQNDKSDEGQKIVKEEIVEALKTLKNIKDLYDGSEIDHLNIYHEISLAFWDPYEDDWEIKNIDEAKKLKEEIWANNNYLLFKLILRPGYKSREKNPNITKDFKANNIPLLEQIIEFGEKEKSVYGSVKFFFKDLSEQNEKVFEQILKQAEENKNSYLWYYLGFGFSDISQAIVFAKKQEKSKRIIHIKAGIDAFYHPKESLKTYKKKIEVRNLLEKLIKSGSELIKKDPHDIFWWSMSASQSIQYLYYESKDDTKDAIELLTILLNGISAKDKYNDYLFNAVAESVFFLRNNIDNSCKESLKKLLDKYLLSGEPNLNTEELFNVVASKVDPLVVIDFYKKRLTSISELANYKRIPYGHSFVFENNKNIEETSAKEVLQAIADLGLAHKKKINYGNVSKIFIDFATSTKYGIDFAIDWLKDGYLSKNNNEFSAINAVRLLEDFDDYSNKRFWDFLKWVMINFDSKEVRSAIWATYISGSVDLDRITQKEKALNEWLKSDNQNVKDFAEINLLEIIKDRERFWNTPAKNIIDNTVYPAKEIYDAARGKIQGEFYDFVKKDIIQIGSIMQMYQPSFKAILKSKSRSPRPEEIIRDIIVLQLLRYFTNVEAEAYHRGKVDIKIKNFDNNTETMLIECLRWEIYKTKKITGRNTYKSKIEQIFGYRDSHQNVILITFVENAYIPDCITQAKEHSKQCNIIDSPIDNELEAKDNLVYSFISKHASTRGNVNILHVFYNFKE